MIDWKKGEIDLAFGLFEEAAKQGFIIDIQHSSSSKRVFTYFHTPVDIPNAKVLVKCEVDDIKQQVYFKDVTLSVYQKSNTQTEPFFKHCPIQA